ncbi:MAG TPA: phosphotransferase [Methylomirabilota bacterium]|nr:phosphotransferase [Methylomirabilota bacterium]
MSSSRIGAEALARYLAGVLGVEVRVLAVRPLSSKHADADDPKGFGYGVPLEVECTVGGAPRSLVVARTRPAQGFGHDYPADRAWQALYGHTAYNGFPRHARSLDVGFVRAGGELVSAADATEFFQLVEKIEGTLYWLDLDRLLEAPARDLDLARAEALGRFLAEAHAVKRDEPTLYHRRIRELVGHGECLMGILDSYPHPYPLLPPAACAEIERAAVAQRWRLRGRAHRLSRTHGDFHPWNLLFREGTDFSVLDRSRGDWGEPADDVAALGVNYLFYGLRRRQGPAGDAGPFPRLFDAFLDAYLRASRDEEVREALPPFFAFRAIVIAHPLWYPELGDALRGALIAFAQRMMADTLFDAADVRALLEAAR